MTVVSFRHELRGEHVHVDVFVGLDEDHMALSGHLIFSLNEWEDFLLFVPQDGNTFAYQDFDARRLLVRTVPR